MAAQALAVLWETIETELADGGSSCRSCGQCCDFPRRDHVLFASKLELDVCLAWSREHLAIPEHLARERLAAGLCPFFENHVCGIHAARPIACRVFFCDPATTDRLERLSQVAHRAVRNISKGHGELWWYGPALEYYGANITVLPAKG